MTRKRPGKPSMGVQIEALFRNFIIACHICGERILWGELIDWDHWLEHADTKDNSPQNYKPVHRECHPFKSGKATKFRKHIERLEKEKNGEPKRARDKFKKPIPQKVDPWGKKWRPAQ